MGVLLSGMAGDGKLGTIQIKRHGGVTVVESPETSMIHGMAYDALCTGYVDHIIRLPGIIELIKEFAKRKD
jgi:chemotaxis response regulator CheB